MAAEGLDVSINALKLDEVSRMSVEKVKGQIKETTGKITGDTGLEVEGKFGKGVAEVKEVAGAAVDYLTDMAGAVVNVVTGTVSDLWAGVKKMLRKAS